MTSIQQFTAHKHFKKFLIISFLALSLLVWIILSIYHTFYISTDDAYVNANVVQMASRITGKVDHLYIKNNQHVKRGDILFEIDPAPFQVSVEAAKADLAMSLAQLNRDQLTAKRTDILVKNKFSSAQEGDNSNASLKMSQAAVERAKSRLEDANLNLSYTKIVAPVSGWVTNVTLREGDMVTPNQPLFALISDEEFWVDANFKETELSAIKPNQKASIVSDMYPGYTFQGVVESISYGTGSAFSLLPPQNATGNWVKVTQRVPVRIRVLQPNEKYPLRVGTSVTATISLHS